MTISDRRGFTLLELVVALTLFMLMSVAVFALLRIGVSSWSRSSDRMSEQLRFRTVSESIEKQIACFSPVMIPLDSGLIRGQKIPYFRGTSDQLEFVSLSALRFQESPGLTIVSYYVKDEAGRRYLVEYERRYLGFDSLNREPNLIFAISNNNPEAEIKLFEVEQVEFLYYEKSEDGLSTNRVDFWDSTLRWQLPSAVELKVLLKRGGNKIASSRRFVIPIMAKPLYQPNTRQMQPRAPSTLPSTIPPPRGIR